MPAERRKSVAQKEGAGSKNLAPSRRKSVTQPSPTNSTASRRKSEAQKSTTSKVTASTKEPTSSASKSTRGVREPSSATHVATSKRDQTGGRRSPGGSQRSDTFRQRKSEIPGSDDGQTDFSEDEKRKLQPKAKVAKSVGGSSRIPQKSLNGSKKQTKGRFTPLCKCLFFIFVVSVIASVFGFVEFCGPCRECCGSCCPCFTDMVDEVTSIIPHKKPKTSFHQIKDMNSFSEVMRHKIKASARLVHDSAEKDPNERLGPHPDDGGQHVHAQAAAQPVEAEAGDAETVTVVKKKKKATSSGDDDGEAAHDDEENDN